MGWIRNNHARLVSSYGIAAAIGYGIAAPSAAGALDQLPSLPDPTRPAATATQTTRDEPVKLELQSTLVSNGRRTAIINGRLHTVGSRIEDAKVIDITPGRVLVRLNGRDVTLRLIPPGERVRRAGGEGQ